MLFWTIFLLKFGKAIEIIKYFPLFSGINARAPPENYFGRTIGQFTDFAHGIRVRN